MHLSTLDITGSAPNLPRQIDVAYLITNLTSAGTPMAPDGISLGPVYPHPVPIHGEARIVNNVSEATTTRLVLSDLLGRVRAVLHQGTYDRSTTLTLRPARIGLAPGSYLLRLYTGGAVRARMVTVVR
jgi:hypothetical protein